MLCLVMHPEPVHIFYGTIPFAFSFHFCKVCTAMLHDQKLFPSLFAFKGPSPGLAFSSRQAQCMHYSLTIVSAKYYSAASHENS